MYPDLIGKTAVVTGASMGLGRGIAQRFLQEGMNVVINYHSDKHKGGAQELADSFNESNPSHPQAVLVQGDVADAHTPQALRAAALEHFGAMDVWVNNAGISSRYASDELPLDQWNRMISVNLSGTFMGSQAALQHFVERDIQGCIINMSSVHELIPWPTYAAYAASKGGIKLFSQTIALEYAHRGIRVNCIAPGAINTPINKEKFADPTALEQTKKMIPMHTIGKTEQVAAAAAWLASDESSYVSGQSIFVDGGMSLYPSFEKGDG